MRLKPFVPRAALAVVLLVVACGGEGPTTPTPTPNPEAVNHIPANAGQIATTPQATPNTAPTGDLSYVELNTDGSGRYCAMPKGGQTAYIVYTPPGALTPIYGRYETSTAVGTCIAIPKAEDVVDFPWCGPGRIQVDVNQDGYLAGRHLGHVFATVDGERGEWKELEPKITYGEWGECKPDAQLSTVAPKCHQSRTKRTIIEEKNSCTGEVRVKSDKTDTETRECECKCIPEWKELPPVITYGEWGECRPTSVPGVCAETRTVTTVIKEKNTCTDETREKSRRTTEESRPCKCDTCQPINLGDKNLCFGCPLGNERDECAYFGLVPLGKDDDLEGGTFIATMDADLAIVKGASCYKLYSPVTKGQTLRGPEREAEIPCPNAHLAANCIDISHVTYCGCE